VSRKRRTTGRDLALGVALALAAAPSAGAAEIEGVRFADRVGTEDGALELHGVGLLRWRYLFKAYVGALYLPGGARAEDALADVPKQLVIHYFHGIRAEDFGKAALGILERSFDAQALAPLRERVERLHALYESVRPGDRYVLTYLPDRGTTLALNGVEKGTIPGADFARAYFSIWLGPQPADRAFRDQLLNGR
jgi:hypothetical protein